MNLYLIEVANYQDDTMRPYFLASMQELTKDDEVVKAYATEGWEYISRIYKPQIDITAWSEQDFNGCFEITSKINQ